MGKQLVNFITCGCETSAPFCNLQSRVRAHAVLVVGLYELLGNPTTYLIEPPGSLYSYRIDTSCGTVALYGPFSFFFFSFFLTEHRATDFTLSKICETATKNSSHLSTVIFTTNRFVRIRVITKLPNSEQSYKGKVKNRKTVKTVMTLTWYRHF
jgi:hypothetical protein